VSSERAASSAANLFSEYRGSRAFCAKERFIMRCSPERAVYERRAPESAICEQMARFEPLTTRFGPLVAPFEPLVAHSNLLKRVANRRSACVALLARTNGSTIPSFLLRSHRTRVAHLTPSPPDRLRSVSVDLVTGRHECPRVLRTMTRYYLLSGYLLSGYKGSGYVSKFTYDAMQVRGPGSDEIDALVAIGRPKQAAGMTLCGVVERWTC